MTVTVTLFVDDDDDDDAGDFDGDDGTFCYTANVDDDADKGDERCS